MIDRRRVLQAGGSLVVVGAGVVLSQKYQMGTAQNYTAAATAVRRDLPAAPDTRDLVRFATLAASGHNTQPWKFRTSVNTVEILPDLARRTPVVDPDDHHLFVSLGCAAENLSLAAASRGKPGELVFDPVDGGSIKWSFNQGASVDASLSDAIPHRQSTRTEYHGGTVSTIDLAILSQAAAVPGVDLSLVTDRSTINRIGDLVIAGNSTQLADAAFLRELKAWLRFNPRTAQRSGDGLYSATTGNPALPDWLGPLLFDWTFSAKTEKAKYVRQIASSAGIAVFTGAKPDPEHWVLVGRACQRFALQATALGLKHAFLNQPVEVASLRPDLAAVIGSPGRRPDLVMRFGHGPTMPFSPRRTVESVFMTTMEQGA